MKDYHTHVPNPCGGCLCAVRRDDWPNIAAQRGMTPCFGIHPWYVCEAEPRQIAADLREWLALYPSADVGETGLDATPNHRATLGTQREFLQLHLNAAFEYNRTAHLHGARAWGILLELLRARKRADTLPRILLHAWNGSPELASAYLALGAVFSVGLRELEHPRARERYRIIPQERLFPETDDRPETWERVLALYRQLGNGSPRRP